MAHPERSSDDLGCGFRADLYREAMGPGYQLVTFSAPPAALEPKAGHSAPLSSTSPAIFRPALFRTLRRLVRRIHPGQRFPRRDNGGRDARRPHIAVPRQEEKLSKSLTVAGDLAPGCVGFTYELGAVHSSHVGGE